MHAVIFDIDGTLIQSAEIDDYLYREAVRAIVGPVRFRNSLHDYDFVSDSGILSQLLEDNGLSGLPDPTERIQARFVEYLQQHIDDNGPFIEIPGARRHLDSLRNSNEHGVAIATGGWQVSARLKLASAGFETDGIPLASSDVAPDRTDIMRSALVELGTSFESITYYGDGPWDRDACERLGWRFVAVGTALDGITSFDGG